ncbi:MAG: sucrose phosphorylase [Pseudomonadota bacterium]
MSHEVQLIAYGDRLGDGTLKDLKSLLEGPLAGLFGGLHLLPFYDSISGADAGFDPTDHLAVDPVLGDWGDVRALAAKTNLVVDLIVNHISSHSAQFQHYLTHGAHSPYAGMFLTEQQVFPGGMSDPDRQALFVIGADDPFVECELGDGTSERLWATFTQRQIDLNPDHHQTEVYLDAVLTALAKSGARRVRLDAVGFTVKTRGTSCFLTPATFAYIDRLSRKAHALGLEVLAETHTHFERQGDVAQHVDWVYDFALGPLLLHSLFEGNSLSLKRWLAARPRNAITVLDTHDGIDVGDVAADKLPPHRPGLLDDAAVDALVARIHRHSGGVSARASGAAAGNVDVHQINCTYYDALGADDEAYLAARLVQLFSPGIAQIYYVGLLAGSNDVAGFARSGVGRDVNRRYYTQPEVEAELARPVVRRLMGMIRLRNHHPAFRGTFEVRPSPTHTLLLRRACEAYWAEAHVDFRARSFTIRCSHPETFSP